MKFLAGLFFLATVLADRVAVVDLKTYGKIAFYQQAVNGSEMCISFNLTNLNGSAGSYHVHQTPIGADEYACGSNATGGHYDTGFAEPSNIMVSLIATDAPTAPTPAPTDAPTEWVNCPTQDPAAVTYVAPPTDECCVNEKVGGGGTECCLVVPTNDNCCGATAGTTWIQGTKTCCEDAKTLTIYPGTNDEEKVCCPNALPAGDNSALTECPSATCTNAGNTWVDPACCPAAKTLVTNTAGTLCCTNDLPAGDNSALTECPARRRRRLLEVTGTATAAANLVGADDVEVTWCFTPPRASLFDDILDRSVVVHKADGGARWFCGNIVEEVADPPTPAEATGTGTADSAAPVSAPQFFFISFLFVFLRL